MRLLKETLEIRANSEIEAKEVIESYRQKAAADGFTIGAAGYTYKTKKSKGEIIDEWIRFEITKLFNDETEPDTPINIDYNKESAF